MAKQTRPNSHSRALFIPGTNLIAYMNNSGAIINPKNRATANITSNTRVEYILYPIPQGLAINTETAMEMFIKNQILSGKVSPISDNKGATYYFSANSTFRLDDNGNLLLKTTGARMDGEKAGNILISAQGEVIRAPHQATFIYPCTPKGYYPTTFYGTKGKTYNFIDADGSKVFGRDLDLPENDEIERNDIIEIPNRKDIKANLVNEERTISIELLNSLIQYTKDGWEYYPTTIEFLQACNDRDAKVSEKNEYEILKHLSEIMVSLKDTSRTLDYIEENGKVTSRNYHAVVDELQSNIKDLKSFGKHCTPYQRDILSQLSPENSREQ